MSQNYITIKEAAVIFKVSYWTVWRRIRAGKLFAENTSNSKNARYFIPDYSLDEYLSSRYEKPQDTKRRASLWQRVVQVFWAVADALNDTRYSKED